jgi:hypothetical protein
MQLIGTTPTKRINNGLVLQLCVKEVTASRKEGLSLRGQLADKSTICGKLVTLVVVPA